MRSRHSRRLIEVTLALCVISVARNSRAQQTAPVSGFFADDVVTEPAPPVFTAAPVLSNNNASAGNANAVLNAAKAAGKPLAIVVLEPLTNASVVALFDQQPVRFVFGGFVDSARVGRTRSIADQVLSSTQSQNAFVGNFNFYPNSGSDPTRPADQPVNANSNFGDARGRAGSISGNQVAMPALLPGSIDFRNPSTGNSGAPNIRSALFTLPIQRLTMAQLGLRGFSSPPSGSAAYAQVGQPNAPNTRLIPWVSRFNNWNNASLGGASGGTGFVQNASSPANGQLLSRGDFQAMILHYRLRGADSVALAESENTGVVGYTTAQAQDDVRTGWRASNTVNQIFGRGNYAFANLSNVVGDQNSNSGDVGMRSTEVAGVVWSGVYDRAGSTDPASGRRKLMILLSNLGTVRRIVDLPNNIGGFSTFKPPGSTSLDRFDDFAIDPGIHRLLNFSLQQSSRGRLEWVFQGDSFIGLDNNRNGTGVGYEFPLPPGPDATITVAPAVCAGSSGNVASVPAVNGYTYSWSVTGGTLQSGQGTRSITYAPGNGSSLTINVTVTDPALGTRSRSKNVSIVTSTSVSVAGRSPTCSGQADNLYAGTATDGVTHSWTITGNGSIVGPIDGKYVNVTAGAPGSFTIRDTVSLNGACQSSNQLTVPVDSPMPPPDITASPDPVPANASASATTSVTGVSYSWQIQNGTIQGTPSAQTVNYTAGNFGRVILTLTITTTTGSNCSSSSNLAVPINAPNEAPKANPDLIVRYRNESVTFPQTALTDNDTDREETELTVTSVTQPGSGTTSLNNGVITYTPNPASNFEDLFNYTINDGQGGTASSQVRVTIQPTLSIERAPPEVGGGVTLLGTGAGGAFYVLQWRHNFADEWVGLTTFFMDENGNAQYTHNSSNDPAFTPDQAFYRINN